jgi:hypothetical protein
MNNKWDKQILFSIIEKELLKTRQKNQKDHYF